MPKTNLKNLPKWANEPLKFPVNPDAALAKVALKPKKFRAKRK